MDDVYVISDHILAGDRITRVSGSIKLDRDLRRDLRALDPNGDVDFARELRKSAVETASKDDKWCYCCGWTRPIYMFDYDAKRTDKRYPRCKECRRKYNHLDYQGRKRRQLQTA